MSALHSHSRSALIASCGLVLGAVVACGGHHSRPARGGPEDALDVTPSAANANYVPRSKRKRVILFVWDGLRPDSVNAEDTPRLARLAAEGVFFTDHHATFPSFTMVNAATLATGGLAETTGYTTNWVWQPGAAKGSASGAPLVDANGAPVRYEQPFFTEDYIGLRDLDAFYGGELLLVRSLFETAHAAGLNTIAIGKSGPAFLQDRHRQSIVFDERAVWPRELVLELQKQGVPLPKHTAEAYPDGDVTLVAEKNGDPTEIPPSAKLADGKTPDPTSAAGAPGSASNAYLMNVYLEHLLAEQAPELTAIWNRNPDTAQHWYGPGTRNVKQALHEIDAQLGALLDKVAALGWTETTNVVVVSDHGHSSVSGPLASFPLRNLVNGAPGAVDPAGFSVSGDVRLADLMTRIGKFDAYDGLGCLYNPVISGIGADGKPLYQEHTDDASGKVCGLDAKTGQGGMKYTTPAYRVPAALPADAVIVALNGGTDAVYLPSHDPALALSVVRFLQGRPEVGAIFVSGRYPMIPGTLPMSSARIESRDASRNADLFVSYAYDENAVVQGMPGIIYGGAQNYRGMHGSFSPVDIHNTLIAAGPDFRKAWKDTLPTGNVDVAPTIARILGLDLPSADGRVLEEALAAPDVPLIAYDLRPAERTVSSTATGLKVMLPTDTDGKHADKTKSRLYVELSSRRLIHEDHAYTYFDFAKAIRE